MAYLKEFKDAIDNNDFAKFLRLWEEYANAESVDAEEFEQLLELIKGSDFSRAFGQYAETALPLWSSIQEREASRAVLRLIIDLQTSNSALLREVSQKVLQERFASHPHFNAYMRMVGLRGGGDFQGAIGNFELLVHMKPGKFVFHTGGWGTGEVIDLSLVREQVVLEFEHLMGRRDMSFVNAFKTLSPLGEEHFLARRFGDPDALEAEAKEDPSKVVRLLLSDLGPKTAAEIKEELCQWVIPEKAWTKWWQAARNRLKRDTLVETPQALKEPFKLRKTAVSHVEQLKKEIHSAKEIDEVILATYNFVRDFPTIVKKEEVKRSIVDKLQHLLERPDLSPPQEIQILLFLEHMLDTSLEGRSSKEAVSALEEPIKTLDEIQILALKKRALMTLQQVASDWQKIFLQFLFDLQQNPLREYLLQELTKSLGPEELKKELEKLLKKPQLHPEAFVWYFQKEVSKGKGPFADKEGQCRFLESFFILFHKLESHVKYRDLLKKMYQIISSKRYAVIRSIIEDSSPSFIREFLLLISKCHELSSQDKKFLRSLAEVAHPDLVVEKEKKSGEDFVIWTTEEGFEKTRERLEQIRTVEMAANAKELNAARALGDLRENAEYKAAKEKRARLQSEIKTLSEQLGRARIITPQDISTEEVGVGVSVELLDSSGRKTSYTILGPWESRPEEHILSHQSKFAQAMMGRKEGESFTFRDESYSIAGVQSYLKQER